MIIRASIVALVWALFLFLANPFFENKPMRYVTLALAMMGSAGLILCGS